MPPRFGFAAALLALLALLACGTEQSGLPVGGVGGGGFGGGSSGGGGTSTAASAGAGGSAMAAGGSAMGPCPDGVSCVTSFPFSEQRDTSVEGDSLIDVYACKPEADESGPEVVYRVTVPTSGFLSAAIYDGSGVDIDVHVLETLDGADCLDRGDRHARADVTAGTYWVVADSYVAQGVPQAGAFRIDIGFVSPSSGDCAMSSGEMPRVGDGGNHLAMPATGPIVMEAHLVTDQEPPPYPSTSSEELEAHYALSQAATGLVMARAQSWAPLEGGDFYGCGIGSPSDFPLLHEAWYVNMYWTSAARPDKGTKMILREPGTARAVVVAAGYETGPGNLSHIGGTPEETHFYLGSGHLSELELGTAADQTLPYGPRRCR